MKNDIQRINNIIGQLEGIKKMLDSEEECTKIMIQFKAVKSALNSVMIKVVNDNAQQCLKNLDVKKSEELKNIISEIIKI